MLATAGDVLPRSAADLDVLDVGSGYGFQARELARTCRTVTGLEPTDEPCTASTALAGDNRYLRASGRGDDYTDASCARTAPTLSRHLDATGWTWQFRLPADPTATHLGTPRHYRVGTAALRRVPALWLVSKSFLVLAVKDA